MTIELSFEGRAVRVTRSDRGTKVEVWRLGTDTGEVIVGVGFDADSELVAFLRALASHETMEASPRRAAVITRMRRAGEETR